MTVPPPVPTLADIQAAARRLAGAVVRTPLLENPRVNERIGGRLFLKAESLQRTGSFKFRGAYNFISQMNAEQRARGVVAWSSGNHAQGVAEAARVLAVRATIVMPTDAPALKVANTRASGAKIVLYDRERDDREAIARNIASESGATPIPPYDHERIICGQGTVGLEIVEQAREAGASLDAVVANCSGGGLSTGVATAVKGLSPSTDCYAAEPAGFDDLARSLAAGAIQRNDRLSGSICDALLAPEPGRITFPIAREKLSGSLVATDDEVLDAMALALKEYKIAVEPGGAVALAAILKGAIATDGKAICVVCSGGNADADMFVRALARPR